MVDRKTLRVRASVPPGDPFAEALRATASAPAHTRFFAGVGVDFSNRRRNKLNGFVNGFALTPSGTLELELRTTENMG